EARLVIEHTDFDDVVGHLAAHARHAAKYAGKDRKKLDWKSQNDLPDTDWCRNGLANLLFRLAHREGPLSQHAVLIPDLRRPDARHDLPGVVEAVAKQAKRADLQIGKSDIGSVHHIAGIRIADTLRREVQDQVRRHAVANRITVNAKLDAELGAD